MVFICLKYLPFTGIIPHYPKDTYGHSSRAYGTCMPTFLCMLKETWFSTEASFSTHVQTLNFLP